MAGETVVTIIGNLTADPELSFTQSGLAVANFTVASTPRTFDKQSGEWKDGEALFMRCSVWREYAENVAESLQKGMRVMVNGRMRQRSYDAQDGTKRTVIELDVDEVGPCLRYATASVNKTQRSGGSRGGQGGYGGGQAQNQGGYGGQPPQQSQNAGAQRQQQANVGASDPWQTAPAAGNQQKQGGGDWGGTFDEEPPF